MATIKEIYENVNRTHGQIPDQIDSIVRQLGEAILKLNTEDQLFEGIDNEGNNIGRYKRATEQITQGISGKGYPKKAGELFNLYATGNLFKSIDAVFENNKIDFFTRQPNHPFFQKNPTQALKLMGLTPENAHKLNYEMIKPLLIKWLKKSI
jgi:hypothetical protein